MPNPQHAPGIIGRRVPQHPDLPETGGPTTALDMREVAALVVVHRTGVAQVNSLLPAPQVIKALRALADHLEHPDGEPEQVAALRDEPIVARAAAIPRHGLVRCPYDDCTGTVVEVDEASRWNDLGVEAGELLSYPNDNSPEWQHTGFACTKHGEHAVTVREDFEPAY